MKLLTLISFWILCLTVNAVNRCHYQYEEKVVESLVETIGKITEELETAKTSSFALVFEDLSQGIERVLQELSYILDLFNLVDEKDVDLTTKDMKELNNSLIEFTDTLKDLEAWNKINANNRRKRQTVPLEELKYILNSLSSKITVVANRIIESLRAHVLTFCPACGTLIPANDPNVLSFLGLDSGTYFDGSVVYPGVSYLPSCDGNRPARISNQSSFSPCALQEMMGANGSFFCNHPALKWTTTKIQNAFLLYGAATLVRKGSGDQFFVARFNITKDGLTYSTIGYYFIYDFSIEFWDGTQTVRSTDYPNNFDILTCNMNQEPANERIPCRWSQTNITDANGNYLKTACIVPLAHSKIQAFTYCQSIGWKLYIIESEDERAKLSDFVVSVQPGIYNIEGRKGIDGAWYCGVGASCFSQPIRSEQWPDGACTAFSFDVKGDQQFYAITSDCYTKLYSICQ